MVDKLEIRLSRGAPAVSSQQNRLASEVRSHSAGETVAGRFPVFERNIVERRDVALFVNGCAKRAHGFADISSAYGSEICQGVTSYIMSIVGAQVVVGSEVVVLLAVVVDRLGCKI